MTPDMRATIYSNIVRNWLRTGPILTALMLYIGATPVSISIAAGMAYIVKPIEWFVPRLMHKFPNRKRMLTLCNFFELAFLIAAGSLALFLPNHWRLSAFMAAFLVSSVFMAVRYAYWTSLIGDSVPEAKQGSYFGNRQMVSFTSGFAALIAGGGVLDLMGKSLGFRLILAASAVLLVLRLRALRKYPNPGFIRSTEEGLIRMMRKPVKDRPFMKMTFFMAVFMFIMYFTGFQFTYIALHVLGIGPLWSAVVSALAAGANMAGSYCWGRLTKSYPTRTLLVWSLMMLAMEWLLFAGLAVFPALFMLGVIQILFGVGMAGTYLLTFLYKINAPRSERPAYSGMYNAITGLAGFFGGLFGGIVYTSTESVWLQGIGIPVTVGILLLVLALISPYVIPHLNSIEMRQSNYQRWKRKLNRLWRRTTCKHSLQERRSHLRFIWRGWQLARMERRLERLKRRLNVSAVEKTES